MKRKEKNYFEGKYYKIVTEDHSVLFSFIVGISNNHAFIQILSNQFPENYYFKYPIKNYKKEKDTYKIEKNIFSNTQIKLNIPTINLHVNLTFTNQTNLKKTPYRPTIMGPASYIKGLECNHRIISLKGTVTGNIIFNQTNYSLNNSSIYIEKDYGTSFPKEYLWMQSSSGKNKDTFVLAQGNVPIFKCKLTGLFLVISSTEKEYVFANYYGAKITQINKNKNKDIITIKQGNYQINITCNYKNGKELPSPKQGEMKETIIEYIECKANIQIKYKKNIIYKNEFTQTNYENTYK